jgi:hypothetical protein
MCGRNPFLLAIQGDPLTTPCVSLVPAGHGDLQGHRRDVGQGKRQGEGEVPEEGRRGESGQAAPFWGTVGPIRTGHHQHMHIHGATDAACNVCPIKRTRAHPAQRIYSQPQSRPAARPTGMHEAAAWCHCFVRLPRQQMPFVTLSLCAAAAPAGQGNL